MDILPRHIRLPRQKARVVSSEELYQATLAMFHRGLDWVVAGMVTHPELVLYPELSVLLVMAQLPAIVPVLFPATVLDWLLAVLPGFALSLVIVST